MNCIFTYNITQTTQYLKMQLNNTNMARVQENDFQNKGTISFLKQGKFDAAVCFQL